MLHAPPCPVASVHTIRGLTRRLDGLRGKGRLYCFLAMLTFLSSTALKRSSVVLMYSWFDRPSWLTYCATRLAASLAVMLVPSTAAARCCSAMAAWQRFRVSMVRPTCDNIRLVGQAGATAGKHILHWADFSRGMARVPSHVTAASHVVKPATDGFSLHETARDRKPCVIHAKLGSGSARDVTQVPDPHWECKARPARHPSAVVAATVGARHTNCRVSHGGSGGLFSK